MVVSYLIVKQRAPVLIQPTHVHLSMRGLRFSVFAANGDLKVSMLCGFLCLIVQLDFRLAAGLLNASKQATNKYSHALLGVSCDNLST
jgi:hypothetical protein